MLGWVLVLLKFLIVGRLGCFWLARYNVPISENSCVAVIMFDFGRNFIFLKMKLVLVGSRGYVLLLVLLSVVHAHRVVVEGCVGLGIKNAAVVEFF